MTSRSSGAGGRLAPEFTEERCAGLDSLLVVDSALGMTPLRWLGKGPVEASPAAVRTEISKLEFLRGLEVGVSNRQLGH